MHPALIVLLSFLAGSAITVLFARLVSPWNKSRPPYVGKKNKEKRK
jgi:hypothetical protein